MRAVTNPALHSLAEQVGAKYPINKRFENTPEHRGIFNETYMNKHRWYGIAGTVFLHAILAVIGWNMTQQLPTLHVPGPVQVHLTSGSFEEKTYSSEPVSIENDPLTQTNDPMHYERMDSDSPALTDKLLLPPETPRYLSSNETDTRPHPIEPVIIPFPDKTLDKPKGTAILVLYIDENGEVENIQIDQSELPPIFEQAAIDAFKAARMYPAMKDGRNVRSRMKVLVEFATQ